MGITNVHRLVLALDASLSWLLSSRLRVLIRPLLQILMGLRRLIRGRAWVRVGSLRGFERFGVTVAALPQRPALELSDVQELERKLWSGYASETLPLLESLVHDPAHWPQVRAEAAWVLSRRALAEKRYADALNWVRFARALQPARGWDKGHTLVETECLIKTGQAEAARQKLQAVLEMDTTESDYYLALANTWAAALDDSASDEARAQVDAERLACLQALYERYPGIAPVVRHDPAQPLILNNLAAQTNQLSESDRSVQGPKVSVLMPVYNAAETMHKAIRGLREQTWQNLEIIPVDDCSTDDSWAVLQHYAEQDSRIKPIQHTVNQGAYGARLTALAQATGDYITVHDADDWSHPQKIQVQVEALQRQPAMKACMTSWCRVHPDMTVALLGAIPGKFMQRQNESSLMFHRTLVEHIGSWDPVRAGGDTEYIWRIQAAFGKEAVQVIEDDLPLSFSLTQSDSLTQSGPTHVRTIFDGTRRVYREAQKWWHSRTPPEQLKLNGEAISGRPFPAPANMLHKQGQTLTFDRVLIADFAAKGELRTWLWEAVQTALQTDDRIALFQWRHFETRTLLPIPAEYQVLAAEGKVQIISADDRLQADTAVVLTPTVARHRLDRYPDWQLRQALAVQNAPRPKLAEVAQDDEQDTVESNLTQALGHPVQWIDAPACRPGAQAPREM